MSSFWVSAEAMIDLVTWSKIPDSFTEEQKQAFKEYHEGKMGPQQCCDILGIKHSYEFDGSQVRIADGQDRRE